MVAQKIILSSINERVSTRRWKWHPPSGPYRAQLLVQCTKHNASHNPVDLQSISFSVYTRNDSFPELHTQPPHKGLGTKVTWARELALQKSWANSGQIFEQMEKNWVLNGTRRTKDRSVSKVDSGTNNTSQCWYRFIFLITQITVKEKFKQYRYRKKSEFSLSFSSIFIYSPYHR